MLLSLEFAEAGGNLDVGDGVEAGDTFCLCGYLGIEDKVVAGVLLHEVIHGVHYGICHVKVKANDGCLEVSELIVKEAHPVNIEDTGDGGLAGYLVGEDVVAGTEFEVNGSLLHGLECGGATGGCEAENGKKKNKE